MPQYEIRVLLSKGYSEDDARDILETVSDVVEAQMEHAELRRTDWDEPLDTVE